MRARCASKFQSPHRRGLSLLGQVVRGAYAGLRDHVSVPSSSGLVVGALVARMQERLDTGDIAAVSSPLVVGALVARAPTLRINADDAEFQSPRRRGSRCSETNWKPPTWREQGFSPLVVGALVARRRRSRRSFPSSAVSVPSSSGLSLLGVHVWDAGRGLCSFPVPSSSGLSLLAACKRCSKVCSSSRFSPLVVGALVARLVICALVGVCECFSPLPSSSGLSLLAPGSISAGLISVVSVPSSSGLSLLGYPCPMTPSTACAVSVPLRRRGSRRCSRSAPRRSTPERCFSPLVVGALGCSHLDVVGQPQKLLSFSPLVVGALVARTCELCEGGIDSSCFQSPRRRGSRCSPYLRPRTVPGTEGFQSPRRRGSRCSFWVVFALDPHNPGF